ncbi:MAG: Uncharacterized protein FD125_1079 [bacterium]|nr:MAG: Uncharacterized protein FD125_1079 [bacterium]
MDRIGQGSLNEVTRCPHCSVAAPVLRLVWQSENKIQRQDGGPQSRWAAYACTRCGHVVLAKGNPAEPVANPQIIEIIPEARTAHEDVPQPARRFLQQAFETLHAPDAAAVMAGSAVDAMLKEKGLRDGSLYTRIDQALAGNILTESMANWAHEVRLGSNRPRHADEQRPHVSEAEARQSVEFAEALGQFLFVLTARIERGIEAAQGAG